MKDPEKLQMLKKRLHRSGEDSRWLWKNYDRLKGQYPYEFVAVLNKTVLDHDRDIRVLGKRLRERYPDEAGHIAVEYTTPEEAEMIL